MLTVLAALVIVLGLMVSLARHVRGQSAEQLSRRLLRDLDQLLDRYHRDNTAPDGTGGWPPVLDPVAASQGTDEQHLASLVMQNNAAVMRALRTYIATARRRPPAASPGGPAVPGSDADDPLRRLFDELPVSLYDDRVLRDAWGTPILYMPHQHPQLGMDLNDRPFFVSAGPDRQFLTRQDNLYSYETPRNAR